MMEHPVAEAGIEYILNGTASPPHVRPSGPDGLTANVTDNWGQH